MPYIIPKLTVLAINLFSELLTPKSFSAVNECMSIFSLNAFFKKLIFANSAKIRNSI